MELNETIDLMLSDNRKERLKAEYWQTKYRMEKLNAYIAKLNAGQEADVDDSADEGYEDDENAPEIEDHYNDADDDDDYDEDKLTEESYRTTIEEDPDALSIDAVEVADDDDY